MLGKGRLVALMVGSAVGLVGLGLLVWSLLGMVDRMTGNLESVTVDSMVGPMVWMGVGAVALGIGFAVAGGALKDGAGGAPAVQMRCRACKGLAPEDARFCPACGKPM